MSLSRRSLFGGLLATLAAPAIVRTPGLLMPVNPMRGLIPFDWRLGVRLCNIQMAEHYGHSPAMEIIGLIVQQNELMRDLQWTTGPASLRVSLPASTWRIAT